MPIKGRSREAQCHNGSIPRSYTHSFIYLYMGQIHRNRLVTWTSCKGFLHSFYSYYLHSFQDIYIGSKFLPIKYLLTTKAQSKTLLRRTLADTSEIKWSKRTPPVLGKVKAMHHLVGFNEKQHPFDISSWGVCPDSNQEEIPANPELRESLQNNWPVLFKSVKPTKKDWATVLNGRRWNRNK